jgi:small-conductance mechanosensitive channel
VSVNVQAQTTLLEGDNTSTEESIAVADSPEAIRALVARLSDQEIRALLLERLDAVASAPVAAATESQSTLTNSLAFAQYWAGGVLGSVQLSVAALPNLAAGQFQSLSNFYVLRGAGGTWQFLGIFLLAIVMGLAAERIVRTITKPWQERIMNPHDTGPTKESFQLLSMRMMLEVVRLIAFLIVGLLVLSRMQTPLDKEIALGLFIGVIFVPRFLMAFIRFLLAPNRSELRLIHADDHTANYLYRHVAIVIVLMGFGSFIVNFNRLNELPIGELRLGFWINLLIHVYMIYIAWNAREGLTRMLIGKYDDVTALESTIAKYYPIFMIGFTVLIWLVIELAIYEKQFQLLRNQPHYVSLLILLLVPALDTLIRSIVATLFPTMQGEGAVAKQAYASAKRSYLRIGRVLVFGLLLMIIMDVWHIDLDASASNVAGADVASRFIQLLIILSIGYLIWELVSLLINQKLAAEQTAAGIDLENVEIGGEGGGTGGSRLSTILPLLRFTIQTIVIVMTVLIGLSNIGINVTPLLAGAGVVGIAVGFGAQKLVQDVVSGIFFLIDDAFRAGEYVEVEGTVGTIEKISLRSMQLRHHRGGIHTIPYGEIPKLTNYSRDWVLMKLKFTVPFDADIKLIKKLFKKIGAEVLEIPHLKDDFLQPFKSQGVLEVNDVGMVIGGKFMAKPGTQFMMRKEIFQRVQKEFEEHDIQFARKEVRVRINGEPEEEMHPDDLTRVAGAASEIAEQTP